MSERENINTDNWKLIILSRSEKEAFLLKGFLEHYGVPCLLDFSPDERWEDKQAIAVYIPENRESEAACMIAELREISDLTCDFCNAPCEPEDNYCRRCGAALYEDEVDEDSGEGDW